MPYSGGLKRNIVQCLDDYNIPLKLSHTVVDIKGKDRVEAVTIAQVDEKLKPIPGTPPDLLKLGNQCPFASRCSEAMEICTKASPLVTEFGETHKCKCWLHCKERWHEVLKGEDAYE